MAFFYLLDHGAGAASLQPRGFRMHAVWEHQRLRDVVMIGLGNYKYVNNSKGPHWNGHCMNYKEHMDYMEDTQHWDNMGDCWLQIDVL